MKEQSRRIDLEARIKQTDYISETNACCMLRKPILFIYCVKQKHKHLFLELKYLAIRPALKINGPIEYMKLKTAVLGTELCFFMPFLEKSRAVLVRRCAPFIQLSVCWYRSAIRWSDSKK